jgi:Tfp pilus assembly protein PilV
MRTRRATSVVEMTLALLVLTVVVTSLAQLLTTAAAHRRVSEQRRLAAQEAANQAERIALLTWDEATTERLSALKPSDALLAAIPAATVKVALTDEAGPPASKRVRIEVRWTNAGGQAVEPVGLTVWKHAPQEIAP